MGSDEKSYNEMLKSLGRREGVKGLIPSDPHEKLHLLKTEESSACIAQVESMLRETGTVIGPDGVAVRTIA